MFTSGQRSSGVMGAAVLQPMSGPFYDGCDYETGSGGTFTGMTWTLTPVITPLWIVHYGRFRSRNTASYTLNVDSVDCDTLGPAGDGAVLDWSEDSEFGNGIIRVDGAITINVDNSTNTRFYYRTSAADAVIQKNMFTFGAWQEAGGVGVQGWIGVLLAGKSVGRYF